MGKAKSAAPEAAMGTPEDQHARFKATARALGCDEDEAAFDEKLKAIARPKRPEAQDGTSAERPAKGKQAP